MSYFVSIPLPKGMERESRDAFSLLVLKVASGLSFEGMDDWQIDLDAKTLVLGIEREFHDLVGRGKMSTSLKVFFAKTKDASTFRKILLASFEGLKVSAVKKLQHRDWMKEWRKHYKTQTIGSGRRKLLLVPSWKKKPKGLVVRISPGQAFGTGTHATTRLCLEFLREKFSAQENLKVFDFGAGTGILGLAALALNPSAKVTAVESDREALDQCKKNFRLNGKKASFSWRFPKGKFDWVLANVLAPVLLELRQSLVDGVKPDGRVVVSGILKAESDSFHRNFQGKDLSLVEKKVEGDWAAFMYQKI